MPRPDPVVSASRVEAFLELLCESYLSIIRSYEHHLAGQDILIGFLRRGQVEAAIIAAAKLDAAADGTKATLREKAAGARRWTQYLADLQRMDAALRATGLACDESTRH